MKRSPSEENVDGNSGYKRDFFKAMCKGPEVETCLYSGYSKNNMEASGVAAECAGVKVVGRDEFREGYGV